MIDKFDLDAFMETALEVNKNISLDIAKMELQNYAQQRELLKLRWRVNKNVLKNDGAVKAIENNLTEIEASIDEIKLSIKELNEKNK